MTSMKKKKTSGNKEKYKSQSILSMFKQQHQKNEAKSKEEEETHVSDDVQITAVEEASKYFNKIKSETKARNDATAFTSIHRKSSRLNLKRKSGKSELKSSRDNETIILKKVKSSPNLCHIEARKDASLSSQISEHVIVFETCGKNNDEQEHEEHSHEMVVVRNEDTSSMNDEHSRYDIEDATKITQAQLTTLTGDLECEIDTPENNNEENSKNERTTQDEEDPETTETYRIPYYLENFQLILSSVTEDDFYQHLFNEQDTEKINKFNNLSEEAQKLYVRLFQRQLRWLRKDKIKYPKIAEDLSPVIQELVTCGLLLDEENLADLDTILYALTAPDLKELAKTLRLGTQGQRPELIQAIIQHTKQNNITSFFKVQGTGMEATVLKRARHLLGCCYKLEKDARAVFMRCMTLFSLHQTRGDEDEQAGGNQQIFQMLMTNIGKMVYPEYIINRKSTIFPHRDDLLRFETALQLESDMREALLKNDFDTSLQLYVSAQPTAQHIITDEDIISHNSSLPEHLRVYTSGASYTRILSLGVETLQKLRQYQKAVEQLEELLSRPLYHSDYRGRWYDRLAVNTEQHLKLHAQAVDICLRAMKDPHVRTGHRYALLQRAQRICHSPSHKKLKKRWKEFKDDPMVDVQESVKVTIEGRQMFQGVAGSAVWICDEKTADGSEDVSFVKRVEDFALKYYHDHGYPQGIHGEGGTFRNLFGVFLWDIIYTNVPDVFLNKYQSYPLDIISDSFYTNRKEAIEHRLFEIRAKSSEELAEDVAACWEKHYNTFCLGVNWDRFEDCEHMKGLVLCLGGHVIAGIIERLSKDMRHSTGGGPDLTVWNVTARKVKMVEVKGPGDRLSMKQILWLDYLHKLGVDAEVCHVQAVGAKRLKHR